MYRTDCISKKTIIAMLLGLQVACGGTNQSSKNSVLADKPSSLATYLMKNSELQVVSIGDTNHSLPSSTNALINALPDLLDWGMKNLVLESSVESQTCLNRFINSNPDSGKELEEYCDPKDFPQPKYFIPGLTNNENDKQNPRLQADRRVYFTLRDWNWRSQMTHRQKVTVHAIDERMQDYETYLNPNEGTIIAPAFSPEELQFFLNEAGIPGSDQDICASIGGGCLDKRNENIASLIPQVLSAIFQPVAENPDSQPKLPNWIPYTPLVISFARGVEDGHKFPNFARDVLVSGAKTVTFYGVQHQLDKPLGMSYQGKPVRMLHRLISDFLGENKVRSIAPVSFEDGKLASSLKSKGPGIFDVHEMGIQRTGDLPKFLQIMRTTTATVEEHSLESYLNRSASIEEVDDLLFY